MVAKLTALMTLSVASLLCALVPSLALGGALFGMEGPTGDVLLGYAASLGTDLGIISFGMLASTIIYSVGGVVVSVILLLLFDFGARMILWAREMLLAWVDQAAGRPEAEAVAYSKLLPGAALEAWQGWSTAWAWEPFAGLAVLVAVSLGAALFRFQRADIS